MISTLYFSVGIFAVMAAFFGFISSQVLVKKKPVVLASRWILILVSLSLLPAIVLNLLSYRADSDAGLFQLLTPLMFVFLIAFYAVILKGFSLYGIADTDFRRFLLESLEALGVKHTERMNKLVLDDLGTEIHISFQEWMGTGMVKSKDNRKFDINRLQKELSLRLKGNTVATKNVTAYFYIGFAVFMVAASVGLVWLSTMAPL